MKEKWTERLKMWLCDKLGHLGLDGKPWHHNNHKHEVCRFCRRIKSIPDHEPD